jgi:arylsulfatase A
MNRRTFMKKCALAAGSTIAANSCAAAGVQLANQTMQFKIGGKRPNIIFVMVDDAGLGDFNCYHPVTPVLSPNITKLASQGIRFTNAYTPGVVCGPTRSCLMTGYHLGHASMRGNFNSACIHSDDVTIPEVLKTAGYATGGWGKWGIGSPGTATAPERKGFDEFLGYYHQVHAHTHYPDRLYLNGQTYLIPENAGTSFRSDQLVPNQYVYQQNVIFARMKQFIKTQAQSGKPFFAYGCWTLPHNDNTLPQAEAEPGGAYAPYSSESWTLSAKIQAAMITMIDRQVGELVKLLDDPNEDGTPDDSIAENTVIIFASDNGGYEATVDGAWDRNAGLKGAKGSLYEGGIRTPLICVWPGKIKPGTNSDMLTYLVDLMATFADLAGVPQSVPADTDGISLVPALLDRGTQLQHEGIYVQIHDIQPNGSKSECARMDIGGTKWKAIRNTSGVTSLYNLTNDPDESDNVASGNGAIVTQMETYMDSQHTKMKPQFNVTPPQVGNMSKDGIISYGIRPDSSARNWHLNESGDALSLSGQLKDNSDNTIGLYLNDLDKTYQIEMSVTVNGSAKPDLQFSLKGNSAFEYFKGTMATSAISSGATEILNMILVLTDVTPDAAVLGGDLNKALTLYISHGGSSGDISVNNISVRAI